MQTGAFMDTSTSSFALKYQAAFSAKSGSLSSQQLYVQVTATQVQTGKFTEALAIPLAGSAYPTNATSLAALRSPSPAGVPPGEPVKISGLLVADGTWRTLTINLGKWLPRGEFLIRANIVAATSPSSGYTGSVEINIASLAIRSSVPASNLLYATMDPNAVTIQLGYKAPGAGLAQNSDPTKLTLSFLTAQSVKLQPGGSSPKFSSALDQRPMTLVGGSLPAGSNASSSSTLEGMMVYTPFAALQPIVEVNNSPVAGLHVNAGSVFVGPFGNKDPIQHAVTSISASFKSYTLDIAVTDASGNPVLTAIVSVSPAGGNGANIEQTDAQGHAKFNLVPWHYSVSVVYLGSRVGSEEVNFTSDFAIPVRTNVFELGLKAVDSQGGALQGATVQLSAGNETITGVTSSGGVFRLRAVADKIIGAIVTMDGSTYYNGHVQAQANNEIIVLNTSYQPPAVQLTVQAGIVGVILVVAVLLILIQKRPNKFGWPRRRVWA
jgi:hypothetical protein